MFIEFWSNLKSQIRITFTKLHRIDLYSTSRSHANLFFKKNLIFIFITLRSSIQALWSTYIESTNIFTVGKHFVVSLLPRLHYHNTYFEIHWALLFFEEQNIFLQFWTRYLQYKIWVIALNHSRGRNRSRCSWNKTCFDRTHKDNYVQVVKAYVSCQNKCVS